MIFRSHGLFQIKQGDTVLPLRWLLPGYPFVDLPSGDTLQCKLFTDNKFSDNLKKKFNKF